MSGYHFLQNISPEATGDRTAYSRALGIQETHRAANEFGVPLPQLLFEYAQEFLSC